MNEEQMRAAVENTLHDPDFLNVAMDMTRLLEPYDWKYRLAFIMRFYDTLMPMLPGGHNTKLFLFSVTIGRALHFLKAKEAVCDDSAKCFEMSVFDEHIEAAQRWRERTIN